MTPVESTSGASSPHAAARGSANAGASAQPAPVSRRGLYGPTLVLGLASALGVVVGASRPWLRATATVPGLPTIHASVSGADLVPLAGALGVAMLAAFGAVVATRGVVRRLLGLAVLVAAVVVLVVSVRPSGATDQLMAGLSARGWSGGDYSTQTTAWRWLVVAGAVAAGAAGALTAAFGNQWAVMGARYDAPTPLGGATEQRAEDLSEIDVWRALDGGRDPTQDG